MTRPVIALAMVGRSAVSYSVLTQWILTLRDTHWPGPCFTIPEIYAAGHWIGVVPQRNLATHIALQDPSWDALLWIDADHRIQPGLFERCEEHILAGRGVTCGLYYSRSFPFEVQAFDARVPNGVRYLPSTVLVPRLQPPRSEVLPIEGGGTGTMLIMRQVLELMAKRHGSGGVWRVDAVPWEEVIKLREMGEHPSGIMTEDILFCLDVREQLGCQVWLDLDPRMETGHVGEQTVDRRHYIASHQVIAPPGSDLGPLAAELKKRNYEIVEQPDA